MTASAPILSRKTDLTADDQDFIASTWLNSPMDTHDLARECGVPEHVVANFLNRKKRVHLDERP